MQKNSFKGGWLKKPFSRVTSSILTSALVVTSGVVVTGCDAVTMDAEPVQSVKIEQELKGAKEKPPVDKNEYHWPEIDVATAPAELAALETFAVMDEEGPDSLLHYEETLAQFLQRPDAFPVLEMIYKRSIEEGPYTRLMGWKSVFLIGELGTEEAAAFLGELVLTEESFLPSPQLDDEPKDGHKVTHKVEDFQIPLRYTAIRALAEMCKAGVPRADAEMRRLIADAKPEYQEYIALSLNSFEILDAYEKDLRNADIRVRFKKLPKGEDVLQIDVENLIEHKGDFRELEDPYTSFSFEEDERE